ncbi:insulinase family protein [Streptomyces sp. NPDC051109]|uniref:insulinase family protein n=1 Tax=Streptomyces sp. NPDC051109 TaxID=3365642 RepID=UPI00379942A2
MTTNSAAHRGATTPTTDADGITETTVDGVRTVLAPRSGLLTAGLLFRVGRADETLATSGITHLVEHLALHRHGLGDLHYNGATAATYTHFHVTGTPADVVEYLNGVCAALRDLPLDRLETEKEILRTEAAGKGHGPGRAAALWRYGSRSYGLVGYAEAGLHRLTADDVRAWARTRFTAENAVLWITGDSVPEGLDLTLPTGAWHPAPAATSALPTTPAYFQGDDGGVVLTAVVPRSTEANLFAEVLGKELFRALRQKGGYSYTATADYCSRDTDSATVTAIADALPQKQDALVGAFIDVFAKLRAGRIDQADLDAVRASALAQFDTPELAACMLPGHALNLLLRHRNLTAAEARAEIEAVTVADLHRVARAVWDDALMQVPGRGVDWAGLAAAPTESSEIVTGRRYSAVEEGNGALLLGRDGISLVAPRGQVTIRYAEHADAGLPGRRPPPGGRRRLHPHHRADPVPHHRGRTLRAGPRGPGRRRDPHAAARSGPHPAAAQDHAEGRTRHRPAHLVHRTAVGPRHPRGAGGRLHRAARLRGDPDLRGRGRPRRGRAVPARVPDPLGGVRDPLGPSPAPPQAGPELNRTPKGRLPIRGAGPSRAYGVRRTAYGVRRTVSGCAASPRP